mgnify:CR=1 FL=1
MMNIDPYFAIIDDDKQIQEKLKLLADDVFNNNEFLSYVQPVENVYFSELVDLLEIIIRQYKNFFLNTNMQSATSRINYQHLYAISKRDNEDDFIYHLARNIIACLVSEKQKHIEDYIEQLLTNNLNFLPSNLGILVSKDGLIDISEHSNKLKLLDHAVETSDGRRIYLHQFLRRHFNSNFVDTPRILNSAIQQGLKVEVRVDPFRIGDMSRYHGIIECDAWFGPKFNQQILDSKDKIEKVTIHHFNSDNPREKIYNKYTTIFRTSMLDFGKGLRQFFVEEYPPYLDWTQSPMTGVGKKYTIQRFAHFVYDQNNKNFEHIDCAIRIFNREEYDKLYKIANQGNDPGGKVGRRFKMFKISGGVDLALIERSLYAFFRGNIHLVEYFHNLKFSGAVEWFEKKQMERATLVKKYNQHCPY